jgi:hypothetical protein
MLSPDVGYGKENKCCTEKEQVNDRESYQKNHEYQ